MSYDRYNWGGFFLHGVSRGVRVLCVACVAVLAASSGVLGSGIELTFEDKFNNVDVVCGWPMDSEGSAMGSVRIRATRIGTDPILSGTTRVTAVGGAFSGSSQGDYGAVLAVFDCSLFDTNVDSTIGSYHIFGAAPQVRVMGVGDEWIRYEIEPGCSGVSVPTGYVWNEYNWGVAGPSAESASYSWGSLADCLEVLGDDGVMAIPMSVPDGPFMGCGDESFDVQSLNSPVVWLGVDVTATHWVCPTDKLCDPNAGFASGSGVPACVPGTECVNAGTYTSYVPAICANNAFEGGAGGEVGYGAVSCANVCARWGEQFIFPEEGWNFVVVEYGPSMVDTRPCSPVGASGQQGFFEGVSIGVGAACAFPGDNFQPSMPAGYVLGPYAVEFVGSEAEADIIQSVADFTSTTIGDDFEAQVRGFNEGAALMGLVDMLTDTVFQQQPYPSFQLGMNGPVPIDIQFNVLADHEADSWRTFGRTIITGYVLFQVILSMFRWVAWAFGASIASHWDVLRGATVNSPKGTVVPVARKIPGVGAVR